MKAKNRNTDLLHENIKIIQEKLAQNNEIIKSSMEIQSTVFDSLSAGRNNQTISDEQQQSQQLLEYSQQTMYEQHQQQIQQNQHTQNIQLPQQQQQQQQQQSHKQNRSIYVGNLHIKVTENHLYDFFGLRSTKYLQGTCQVDLPLCKKQANLKDPLF